MISPLGSQALKALTPQTSIAADRSRCVRHRLKQNDCRRCMDVCPSGAIAWGEGGLSVSSRLCTQCLRCLSVCPTAALKSPEFSLLQALSDLAAQAEPVLGCPRSESAAHARFPCLAYLCHPELLLLLALVFKDGLQINLTGCRDCPKGNFLADLEGARARLAEIKPDHRIKYVSEEKSLNFEPRSLSRREFFTSFRNRSKRTGSVMIERLQGTAGVQPYGNKQVPLLRTLLLKAMEAWPEKEKQRISDLLFTRIHFTPSCTACGGCVGACPTGAIEPAANPGQAPDLAPVRCVSCGSCSAFCRKGGVLSAPISD